MIYSIQQIEALFRNSKFSWWMLQVGKRSVDEFTKDGSDNVAAWEYLVNTVLPTHPYGHYTITCRTSSGANKNEKSYTFLHEPRKTDVSGLPSQPQTQLNPDFFLRMMDKRDAERATWEAEKERTVEKYIREAKDEREKREKAEKDLGDMKQKWMIMELKSELRADFESRLPKPAPKKKELSDQEKRMWNAAEKVISIAGHSMGLPTAALAGLSSDNAEETEESDGEKADRSGVSKEDKTLLFAVKSLLSEHFGDLIELDVIKVIASLLPTAQGQELKEGIYSFFPKIAQ